MTDFHRAVEDAIFIHAHKAWLTRPERAQKATELGEWRCFSNRHIAAFTGLFPAEVGILTQKTDTTGGTLKPESLPYVLEVIELERRGEVNFSAVKAAIDAGCSSTMLARLTGRPQTTLSRHARLAA